MKHGKVPSRKQKLRIESLGLDPAAWMVTKDCQECFEIVNRETGKRMRLEVGGKT